MHTHKTAKLELAMNKRLLVYGDKQQSIFVM